MNVAKKIIILLGALTCIVCFVISFIIFKTETNNIREVLAEKQTDAAVQTMGMIDIQLYERFSDIQNVANTEAVFDGLYKETNKNYQEKISAAFAKQVNENGEWNAIDYIDTSYTIQASSMPTRVGKKVETIFEKTMDQALMGESVYSDLLPWNENGKTVLFVSPVRNPSATGKPVIGAVVGYYSWNVITEILSNTGFPHVHIIDKDGTALFSSEKEMEQTHAKSLKLVESELGNRVSGDLSGTSNMLEQEFVTTFARQTGHLSFRGNNWILLFGTPVSEIFVRSQKSIRMILVPVIGIFILASIGTLIGVRRYFLLPLQDISRVVTGIRSGDYSLRVRIYSNDEFGQLSEAVNKMTQDISELRTGLEKNVEERTIELERKTRESEKRSKELEEMNQLMIGRELRMIELKKELEKKKTV